jgi:hypothetical protein
MKTFYSILYCPIRPVVDERLSIALLLRTGDKVFFRYSHDKLKVIKELLPDYAYNLLKSSLRNIEEYFGIKNSDINLGQMIIEGVEIHPERFLKPEYFEYLSNYSNNLLHFSKPKSIDLNVTNEVFETLYNKLIFETDTLAKKRSLISEKVRIKVNPKIQGHVNLEVELTSKQISNLIVPTPVWFIGKNDNDVTGEVIDFDKATHHLENDIRQHLFLLQSLHSTKDKYHGKHFLVGNEPKKANLVNHSIWNELRNLRYLSYIAPSETEKITQYIKRHKVSPYFEIQELKKN